MHTSFSRFGGGARLPLSTAHIGVSGIGRLLPVTQEAALPSAGIGGDMNPVVCDTKQRATNAARRIVVV